VVSVLTDKDVDGILAALEPVFDYIVVTHNGSPRALDIETLTAAAVRWFGDDRVVTTETLGDAIDAATALVDEFDSDGDTAGTGIVITGSVVTAGAARSLFGRDPA
jgi:dihydrofolate synthase/folylpolyglutamate synthase